MRTFLCTSGLITLMVLSVWQAGTVPAARADTPSAARVRTIAKKTVDMGAGTQHLMEAWASEEQQMLDRIEDLAVRLKHTQWQIKKNTVFIRTLEEKILGLKQRAAGIEKVESELLPVLDTTLDRLAAHVSTDIPASLDRRRATIAQTRKILDDYDMDLLAKTRAVFDTLSREVDLGYTVGVEEQEIETNTGARQVKLLRVGRIGLFAVTPDGKSGFAWDREQNRFTPLEGSARNLTEAVEMAEGIRLISLSRLPIDLPFAPARESVPANNRLSGPDTPSKKSGTKGGDRVERD